MIESIYLSKKRLIIGNLAAAQPIHTFGCLVLSGTALVSVLRLYSIFMREQCWQCRLPRQLSPNQVQRAPTAQTKTSYELRCTRDLINATVLTALVIDNPNL
jgi:hypothetical protein